MPGDVRTPSVLAVLVVRDGARWLRECLHSLSAQMYERLGVVAVDVGSTDGSRDLLVQALGEARVLAVEAQAGLAGAVRAAQALPAASSADYLLILHGDTALAPDTVARMVEAAEGLQGVERVGVVGPKVVDWDDPRILREVGRSTDRFGHPYTSLQDGEMDQGQYDRVLEVLYVSSCAMLVSREAWQRTGSFDERLAGRHDDLDFCWRARIAGFRVLMTPLATVRHRGAEAVAPRHQGRERSASYYAERAALASMLKNYGVMSLAWLLPLHVVFGIARVAYLAVLRRLGDAYELLSGWTWNLVHLPSTVRRRVRAQSVRSVRDSAVGRFMQSALVRVPRWFQQAEAIFEEQLEEEREHLPVRTRARSLAVEHPVLVGWAVAAVFVALADRVLTGSAGIEGGALRVFPSQPEAFFHELGSAVRTTGLGGTTAASPALAVFGALSWLPGVGTRLAQRILLGVLPPLAGMVLYRALLRQTADRAGAVVASIAYTVSAVTFWAFSEGRIEILVAIAVLPAAFDRVDQAFAREGPARPFRSLVGTGAIAAIGVAFLPGIILAIGVAVLVQMLIGPRRVRGLGMSVGAGLVAAALVFPLVPDALGAPAASFGSYLGAADFAELGRLAPGTAPGTWTLAWFLPVAAAIALGIVAPEHRRRAWRSAFLAIAGSFLAWLSAAGWLPHAIANAPVYIVLVAVAEASVLAYGIATVAGGIQRHAFGYRQVAVGALAVVLLVGVAGQLFQAGEDRWAIGRNGLPSAWPVVAEAPEGMRVLWLGAPTGGRFPAPGGDPLGVIQAGAASVRFSITDRGGASALDVGRAEVGPGYEYARRALAELLAGGTSHGGALLAPLSIRYVVAGAGDLPPAARARLAAQVDLDLVPAGGLVIFLDAAALPPALETASKLFAATVRTTDLAEIASATTPSASPLGGAGAVWSGSSSGGTGFVAEQDVGGWRVEQPGHAPAATFQAFGWAIGFHAAPGRVTVRYADQVLGTARVLVLALLWLAVVWLTRRPASR